MVNKINFENENSFGFDIKGTLTAEDYTSTILPAFDEARIKGHKIRVLFQMGSDFKGFTPGAFWEDFKLGLSKIRTVERCAIVSDIHWLRESSQFFGALIPIPVKVFSNNQLIEAKNWLVSKAEELDFNLNKDQGVLTVEINHPLTTENFASLSLKVDQWIENNGQLKGLVLHTKKFPGWENLGSMISHFEFVKNHHLKVRKVALSADGKIPEFLPHIAKHFIKAEVKQFEFAELQEAQKWATN
jgi:hypothetical protein